MDNSNLPPKKQWPQKLDAPKCDFDAYCRLADIKDNIVKFVQDGKSLYLASTTTGNGKTTWAIKLMHKYFDQVWGGNGFKPRAIFVHIPTFLIKCKDFGNKDPEFERLKKLLPTVDLVVWDDIGGLNMSAYDYSQLLLYVDARSNAGLSNIYTGNRADIDELTTAVGAKIASRVFSSDTEVIIFKGGDMR
jgi:DNA replication protein DnaC